METHEPRGPEKTPRLYGDLAPWYTLLTSPADYEEEATWYAALLREHADREVHTVLELGCGTGANASFMRKWFEMVLVDLSPEMLRECGRVNPGAEVHQGDMRTFRLGRRFDAVFVHDAASYMLTPDDVRATAATVAAHLRPGGAALLCPDDLRENFRPDTSSGGHDAPDGRGLRYLCWSTGGPDDTVLSEYVYLLRERDGATRVEHERHVTGRLPGAVWMDALKDAGLSSQLVTLQHSEVEAGRHHVFAAVMAPDPP